jgi:DNA modification methylase
MMFGPRPHFAAREPVMLSVIKTSPTNGEDLGQSPSSGEGAESAHGATLLEAAIEYRPVASLKPNPRNARTHGDRQISKLTACIAKVGFIVPVLVDEEGGVLAGHGRLEAAKRLNLADVPTIPIRHLTPELKRAFMLADNRLAELAGWDEEILKVELHELADLKVDFDFEITGFDTVDLDRLDGKSEREAPSSEVLPLVDKAIPAITQSGDVWHLGEHRLLCGSALEPDSYKALLGDNRVQMVFTDPPYNVKIDGHVCGLGAVKHRPFEMASGEMSEQEFTDFLAKAMRLMVDHSQDGAVHFACMDWRHMGEILAAGRSVYSELKNLVVWNKTNAGMGSFYRSKHELIFVFKVGTAPHINNFGLGDRGRYRTNVWDYAGVNAFKRGRMDELTAHPTVKPLPMVIDALKDCSKRKGIVLDPFSGSGTTLLAAERTGRRGRGIELDPHYCDVTIERWQEATGREAVNDRIGLTFNKMKRPPANDNGKEDSSAEAR